MGRRVAVVDTPVVVAGFLSGDPNAPVARVFDAMLGGRFVVLLSPRLLAEYREVLMRRRVRRAHGLSADQIDGLLADVAQLARLVDPPAVSSPLIDERDAHLYHLLLTHRDAVLVTADERLGSKVGRRAILPAEFTK